MLGVMEAVAAAPDQEDTGVVKAVVAWGATREVAQVDVAVIDRAEEAVAVEVTVATPEAMGEARVTHIS